jgi:hypothetical protein
MMHMGGLIYVVGFVKRFSRSRLRPHEMDSERLQWSNGLANRRICFRVISVCPGFRRPGFVSGFPLVFLSLLPPASPEMIR